MFPPKRVVLLCSCHRIVAESAVPVLPLRFRTCHWRLGELQAGQLSNTLPKVCSLLALGRVSSTLVCTSRVPTRLNSPRPMHSIY